MVTLMAVTIANVFRTTFEEIILKLSNYNTAMNQAAIYFVILLHKEQFLLTYIMYILYVKSSRLLVRH